MATSNFQQVLHTLCYEYNRFHYTLLKLSP
nr:MAG TPA: hypothetical protein [Caudoviricetes sp.]